MREHFYATELSQVFSGDIKNVIIYLRRIGLLKNDKFCNNCSLQMNIVNYTRNKDKEAFRCMNKSCNDFKKYVSIRKDSIFENFKFCLKNGLLIIWKWLGESSQAEVLREIDVDRLVLMKFYDILRGCCVNFYEENDIKLGGPGIICQKDESLMRYKPEYHRGRCTSNELWVFVIADTSFSPCKTYLTLVFDRSASTLLPIISEICYPETIIMSDEWPAYNQISSMNYTHLTVNHPLNFIDPITYAIPKQLNLIVQSLNTELKFKKA